MSFSAARVGDKTVSNDVLLPPGVPTVLIEGRPAATILNPVTGPVINAGLGMVITGSPTVLIGGMPAAHSTSMVFGLTTTPVGPVPAPTTILKGAKKVVIGAGGGAPSPEIAARVEQMKKEAKAECERIEREEEKD